MTTASGDGAGTFLRSRRWQAAAVVTIFLLVAALHAHNDGLWYQGDAPRHAANGFFWWDLLRAMPVNPAGFVLRYYARYPVITPAAYPPFFYLLEGAAFHLFGPSPYAARMLVLAFAILAGLYTMAWARRWVGAWAGWAGVFLAFLPAIVLWSNTVMLNMPSTALGLAGLYHFRRWTEERAGKQLALAAMFVAAALLTYYPGASVVCVCAAWAVWRRARSGWRGLILLAAAGLLALIPLLVSLRLAPVYASRHLPPVDFLLKPANWTFYFTVLPEMLGPLALVLALAGLAAGLLSRRWRGEAMCLLVWIGALLFSLSLLMARDLRYILLTAPAFLIAIAIGLAFAAERLPMPDPRWRVALLLTGLLGGVGASAAVRMPVISGFEAVAAYLERHAPHDAVLYDGYHDGVFGFYARAADPRFERRIVRGDNLLYHYGPTSTFEWAETSANNSTDDVVNALRTQSGCRWVAIEVGRNSEWAHGQRLLREAVRRPEFELVQSFPIIGGGVRRVDLYRLTAPVTPVATIDLYFPSYSRRAFEHVVPITR